MKDRHRLFVAYVSLIIFSIIGTAASKFLKLDPGPVAPASGFCLILCGACIVGLELGSWQGAIAPLLVGAVSEILGLYTGFPFGRYEYTGTWWPSIPIGGGHLFPLLICVVDDSRWVLFGHPQVDFRMGCSLRCSRSCCPYRRTDGEGNGLCISLLEMDSAWTSIWCSPSEHCWVVRSLTDSTYNRG